MRQEIEMIDHRVFFTNDNWETIYERKPGGKARRLTGEKAHFARFIALCAWSAGPS